MRGAAQAGEQSSRASRLRLTLHAVSMPRAFSASAISRKVFAEIFDCGEGLDCHPCLRYVLSPMSPHRTMNYWRATVDEDGQYSFAAAL
jgi:hypothetical protein